jgi:hypothetical protein
MENMENEPFVDDLLVQNGDFLYSYVSLPEGRIIAVSMRNCLIFSVSCQHESPDVTSARPKLYQVT